MLTLITLFPSYTLSSQRGHKSEHSFIFENPLAENKSYKVTKIIDGDTISVRDNKKTLKIRLLGIDAPEISNSDKLIRPTQKSKRGVQSTRQIGLEAKGFLKKRAMGKFVRFEFESGINFLDQYSRILAYVFLQDGTFLNAELIKQGYAQVYFRGSSKYSSEFERLQREAQARKIGLWKNALR